LSGYVTPALVTALMAAASLGAGAALLAGLRALDRIAAIEAPFWCFGLGTGIIGWLTFFVGISGLLAPVPFAIMLVGCSFGVLFLFRVHPPRIGAARLNTLSWLHWALGAMIVLIAISDLVEALAPAADGDTLAYHFAQPIRFLSAHRIIFVPRAVDATSPMLVNMTYLPLFALGGERAVNLWLFVSGWAAIVFVAVFVHRFLSGVWALALLAILATVPAVVYSAGTGQVEIRLALFVTIACLAAVAARSRRDIAFVVIAGMAAGFYAGGKYTGLLFVAAVGLAMLYGKGGIRRASIYSATAVIAGFQWYFWNWLHTGDPFFPMLFDFVGVKDSTIWNAAQQLYFRQEFFGSELAVPRNLFWFFAYPFKATLDALPAFESARTGLGPYLLLVFPLVVAFLWRHGRAAVGHALFPVAVIVIVFYALWFFTGSSQRIRHLLPLLPISFAIATMAAVRASHGGGSFPPLIAALAATIVIQLGGTAVSSVKYFTYALSDQSRNEFLLRNVSQYGPVPWINAHLGPPDKVAHNVRSLNYLLSVPNFLALPSLQAQLNVRPDSKDPRSFWQQLRTLKITHIFVLGTITDDDPRVIAQQFTDGIKSAFWELSQNLFKVGCLEIVKTFKVEVISSRTLPSMKLSQAADTAQLLRLNPHACHY